MKILHLADLHLGKMIHGVSLLLNGDQPVWVERLLELVRAEAPDAIVIAGDVYDRAFPSAEAVQLLSRLLTELAGLEIPVMIAAGNHDSVQRLSFARQLLGRQGVHISGPLADSPELTHVTLRDEHGPVTFWLMPYVFPALVQHALADESVHDYDTAVRRLLAAQPIDFTQRNVLVAHQNVVANGAQGLRGGSETMVGGVGQVDFTAFDGFDYVALGHIHAAYPVGREGVRYAGSPLCYHFDETRQRMKGPLLVTLAEKGASVQCEVCPIPPLHPMRELRGTYDEVRRALLEGPERGEYLRVVLTDQRVSPEISMLLHQIAEAHDSILMELVSEYSQFRGETAVPELEAMREKSVERLFADFYTERSSGEEPDAADLAFLARVGEHVRGGLRLQPEAADVERMLDYLMKLEENV